MEKKSEDEMSDLDHNWTKVANFILKVQGGEFKKRLGVLEKRKAD